MKRIVVIITVCMLALGTPVTAFASSLDEVVAGSETTKQQTTENKQTTENASQPVKQTQPTQSTQPQQQTQPTQQTGYSTEQYLEDIKNANDLSAPSPGATKVNQGITKVASFIVQILSYFITAFLVVRVLVDLCYICVPFTRSFLANGYGGNPQTGGGMGPQQSGMGMGMNSGMGGMGMGIGMGMHGGYGMNRMGMGGMGIQGGNAPGANPAMGRVQWVSTAALNAAAAEQIVGPDGKAISPLKMYAKDMIVVLVITPVLLTLAITGVLTDLGFLIGKLIADTVSGIGGML